MEIVFNNSLPVFIGADHAGFQEKQPIVDFLKEHGFAVVDKGTFSEESVDYPDYAHPVADAVEKGEAVFGVLLCGTANGVAITANKHQGIRAAIAWNAEVAKLVRLHNDANILCIPARFIDKEDMLQVVATFISTAFEGGRHARRLNKMACV